MACENETIVKLASSTITVWKHIRLKIESDNDLTGTRITSSKPLSVFSGSDCVSVPQNIGHCNHLVEQVPLTVTWGLNSSWHLSRVDLLVNVFVFLVPKQQV